MTFEDIIIEMMPFAKELKSWCNTHPKFAKALKIIYSERFITLQAIITSYSPNFPEDEVIGILVYDYQANPPCFKQDFIVNIGGKKKEFVLYTGAPKLIEDRNIKHINHFLKKVGFMIKM